MTIAITIANITDYATIPEGKTAQAQAWLNSINSALTARYGSIPAGVEYAVYDLVGQAITERFNLLSGQSPDPRIKSQSVAGASVEYFPGTTSGYFDASQIATLDELLGGGSVRSVRTPAPDGIRYGNLLRNPFPAGGDIPIEAVI